jgi:hypothetical protein
MTQPGQLAARSRNARRCLLPAFPA